MLSAAKRKLIDSKGTYFHVKFSSCVIWFCQSGVEYKIKIFVKQAYVNKLT